MDCQAVALRVLAHFVPGPKVLEFLASEADWLDIRWCADDDSPDSQASFYRELPHVDVIWHVLRPLRATTCCRRPGCGWSTSSGPALTPSTSTPPRSAVSPSPTCPAPTRRRWPKVRPC